MVSQEDLADMAKTHVQGLLTRQLVALHEVVECNKALSHMLTPTGLNGLAFPSEVLAAMALPQVCDNRDASLCTLQPTNARRLTSGDAPSFTDDLKKAERLHQQARIAMDAKSPKATDLTEPLLDEGDKKLEKQSTKDSMSRRNVFMDQTSVQSLKNELKRKLREEEQEEEFYYSEEGLAQALARNHTFKNAALTVILLNTFWIAIDTDYNKADVLCNAPMLFQVVENFFCVYFSVEIMVRFCAFQNKSNALTDAQFVLDTFLVGTMIWETWVQVAMYHFFSSGDTSSTGHTTLLRIFRLFRVTRSARALRLVRACPEFMIYIKGVFAGLRSVLVTLSLLMVVIYVFAVLFAQTLSGTEAAQGYFETVPQAMDTLLVQGIFADQADIFGTLRDKAGLIYYLLFLAYMVIGSLTIANMLIGVLCEVVQKTADAEEEAAAENALEMKVQDIVTAINEDGSDAIDQEEFRNLLYKDDVMRQLDELGVDVSALVDHAQFLFRNKGEISCGEFFETLMHLRGSANATVKNMADMRNLILLQLHDLQDTLAADTAIEELGGAK